jgi:hypothetical protein
MAQINEGLSELQMHSCRLHMFAPCDRPETGWDECCVPEAPHGFGFRKSAYLRLGISLLHFRTTYASRIRFSIGWRDHFDFDFATARRILADVSLTHGHKHRHNILRSWKGTHDPAAHEGLP